MFPNKRAGSAWEKVLVFDRHVIIPLPPRQTLQHKPPRNTTLPFFFHFPPFPPFPEFRNLGQKRKKARISGIIVSSHEYLPIRRRHDSSHQHLGSPPQNLRNEILLWDFTEDAGVVCAGFHSSVPGSVHRFHLSLQYGNEGCVHCQLGFDRLVYAGAPRCSAVLRQRARYVSALFSRRWKLRAGASGSRKVYIPRDILGILYLLGVGGNSSSVSFATKEQKCGQSYWAICSLSWLVLCFKVHLDWAYRALYILNWIYRYFTENHYIRWITLVAGFLQTALYADFFYYYFISWKNNEKLQLPA